LGDPALAVMEQVGDQGDKHKTAEDAPWPVEVRVMVVVEPSCGCVSVQCCVQFCCCWRVVTSLELTPPLFHCILRALFCISYSRTIRLQPGCRGTMELIASQDVHWTLTIVPWLQWSNRAHFDPLDIYRQDVDWRQEYSSLDPVSVGIGMVNHKTKNGIAFEVVKNRCAPKNVCTYISCWKAITMEAVSQCKVHWTTLSWSSLCIALNW
jgi:hypothetical protein